MWLDAGKVMGTFELIFVTSRRESCDRFNMRNDMEKINVVLSGYTYITRQFTFERLMSVLMWGHFWQQLKITIGYLSYYMYVNKRSDGKIMFTKTMKVLANMYINNTHNVDH